MAAADTNDRRAAGHSRRPSRSGTRRAARRAPDQAVHGVRRGPPLSRARSVRSAAASGPSGGTPRGEGRSTPTASCAGRRCPYAIAYVTLEEGVDHDDQHRRLRPRRDPHRPEGPRGLQAQRGRPAGADVHPRLTAPGRAISQAARARPICGSAAPSAAAPRRARDGGTDDGRLRGPRHGPRTPPAERTPRVQPSGAASPAGLERPASFPAAG